MNRYILSALLVGLIGTVLQGAVWAGGCRIDDSRLQTASSFKLHLGDDCTERDRQARTVAAADILAAMAKGRAVDLSGVVVSGDLSLDSLPLAPLPADLEPVIGQREEARVIAGSWSIVKSVVRGTIRHRSPQGILVVKGPVTFSETRFEQLVDLSRVVFLEPVIWSAAVFLQESYFVQGKFLRDVFAEQTAFGPHTRFHRSHFHGPVSFQQSGFSGMAEFLEVEFDRDANFSRTYYKLGTGFSGSRFHGLADFSETRFDREAFFTFTRFGGDAFFNRATFRSTVDFDDAEFMGRDDFSKVLFEGEATFLRVKRPTTSPEVLGVGNPQVQYVITLSLLVFSAMLIAYLIRSR
ncbi:conserved exported protein of unknown function [Nitrospira sp. KM1]|uniref:pentapeptide repeat-containing protein n=1 Tax=Nitrospira sp. KM1 TaxID=1936990 RepID=UPI0013A70E00|nr:pentapeptide repeat-containing protein [Nitrospira sp. KM1]BCA56863.1 conserved exported protein of unknown function [Nitrospira sp. KM1]